MDCGQIIHRTLLIVVGGFFPVMAGACLVLLLLDVGLICARLKPRRAQTEAHAMRLAARIQQLRIQKQRSIAMARSASAGFAHIVRPAAPVDGLIG